MGHTMSSLKRQKTFVSENDLKQIVQATMQEYGVGITKLITLKTLYQAMSHKYSKSHFHDSEMLRRFLDDHKDKFILSSGGQIVELDFYMAMKLNSYMLKLGHLSNFTATDSTYADMELTSKAFVENGDMDVLSNGGKVTSQEDLRTNNNEGRKESKKSLLSLFRGKKNVTENGDIDTVTDSGKNTSQEDVQTKETSEIYKEPKKSMLSLFRGRKNVTENGHVDILSDSGKSTSQEDVQTNETNDICKGPKKSMLSLFHGTKNVVDGKT